MSMDVPFLDQRLNQANQQNGLIWFDIDDDIDISLHMGTDVSDAANCVDCIPSGLIHLVFDRLNFCEKSLVSNAEEVADHTLQTAA